MGANMSEAMNTTAAAKAAIQPIPTYTALRPSLLSFISDEYLALVMPVLVYWTMGLMFQYFNDHNMFMKYRLHTPEELEKRNKCTMFQVVRSVIMQHAIQSVAGVLFSKLDEPQRTGFEEYEIWQIQQRSADMTGGKFRLGQSAAWYIYYITEPGIRILVAFVLLDTWQFFLHMLMHRSTFLYKQLHSVHHRLYVPYAFGALYNSLLEGFLLDTLGTGLAQLATGLTPREAIVFYTFSTMKTVDDHCGFALPYDPFQLIFPNNAAYHDIHHQHFGIKTNYAQPFFVFWDKLFGTEYKGTKEYIAKQKAIREEKYQKHLEELAEKKAK